MARITQIQVRRSVSGPSTVTGTWAQVNPILAAGEIGLETDTGKFKIGDGSTLWNALGYSTDVSKLNGAVSVANGGTGKSTFGASAGVLKTNGSDVLSASLVADGDLAGSISPSKITGTATTAAQVRARNYQGSNTLDVPNRQFVLGSGSLAVVNGSTTGYLFTPEQDMNVTKISFYVKTAATWSGTPGATNAQAKAALYSVNGTNFTPIAVSAAWQSNPFTATNLYDFNITSTLLNSGTTYAVGMLTTWSGTPGTTPQLAYHYIGGAGLAALSPQMTFITPGQSDIVAGSSPVQISGATGNLTANYARLTFS